MFLTRRTRYSRPRWSLDMLIHTSPSADVHRSPMNYNARVVRNAPPARLLSRIRVSIPLPVPPEPLVHERGCSPGRDTGFRLTFDDSQPCRNRCRSLARSRNPSRPRTWLSRLHSGSRGFNDVVNTRSFSRWHFDFGKHCPRCG